MNNRTSPLGDAYIQQVNQNKQQNSSVKTQDHSNKYSFSSYHMNIISGNKEVQATIPSISDMTPLANSYTHQVNNYMKYFLPQVYSAPQQYIQNDYSQFLNNMYQTLHNQSKLLAYLVQKNEMNSRTTAQIYEQMNKKIKLQEEQTNLISKVPTSQHPNNSDITANVLVNFLYQPKPDFQYKLIVDKNYPLQKTLYKQRNFRLTINLIDNECKFFQNSNKIPISLALYTAQNPPKFLQSNTLGNKMLKGYTQQDLVNGVCCYEKLQIKEVTSHYRKGMLFLVAFAKTPSCFGTVQDDKFVDYTLIHPLVIDKLIVKAKKLKSNSNKEYLDITKEVKQSQEEEK